MNTLTLVIFGVACLGALYFFGIKPSKKQKNEKILREKNLSVGDELISWSGIYCIVTQVNENKDYIKADLCSGVNVKMMKEAIYKNLSWEKRRDAELEKVKEARKSKKK